MKIFKGGLTVIAATLLISFFILSSCKKDKPNIQAIVLNSGPRAADGCGWLIKITGTDSVYSPVNLASAYQTDSLKILINYIQLHTRFQCGILPTGGFYEIKLNGIKKQ